MSYVVNVHYKSDPKDLFWQYSGKTHTCLQDAVDELLSAQKQPHIDKAIVAGSGKGQPVDSEELIDKAVANMINARNHLITLLEMIQHISPVTAYSSIIYASAFDVVENSGVKKDELLHNLEHVIERLREELNNG